MLTNIPMESPHRQSTGVDGLDEILGGGLPSSQTYVLLGEPGSGKTILSLQWLLAGLEGGDACTYLTLGEPGGNLARNVMGFGWDLSCLGLVDLSAQGETAPDGEYHVFPPSEVEHGGIWRSIYGAIREYVPKRLVIDSVTQLRYLSTDDYQFRKHLHGLVAFLNGRGCTTFFLFEPSELQHAVSVGLAVDGIIRLHRSVSAGMATGLRSVQVEKLRGSDFLSGLHAMRITSDGIKVFPHRIEDVGHGSPGRGVLSSGVAEIDALLGDGIDIGAATLLTGPSGVGKSSLGMQFLLNSAEFGRPAIMYTFEETVESVLYRSRSLGQPVDALLEDGSLSIVPINAMELYPDEFLARVRESVERDGVSTVMVDSLRGYELAMAEFGMPKAHIHNLVSYLNRKGVTVVLINEVENITGLDLRATDLGVSHLADTIVLLRYAEYAGQVIKLIGCLKRRLGSFQPELRRLSIEANGISASEQLRGLQGLLTGIPSFINMEK